MCLILQGELRSTSTIKTNKGNEIEVLTVLAKLGKSEQIIKVANFSKQIFKLGKINLSVVPRVNASNNRAFLNWATFEPAQ